MIQRVLFSKHWSFWLLSSVFSGLLLALLLFYVLVPRPGLNQAYYSDEVNKIAMGSPFTFRFTQSMRRQPADELVQFFPHLEGVFTWVDPKTLQFLPDSPLTLHDQLHVQLSGDFSNRYFKTMKQPRTLSWLVTGPPQVRFVDPSPVDHEDCELPCVLQLGLDQPVTIMFDRPMRTIDALNRPVDDPETVLMIDPPIEGEYRWLGTRVFQFVPTAWPVATDFTLTVPEGLAALDDSLFESSYSWLLSTPSLAMTDTTPTNGAGVFPVNGDIILRFNQPVSLDDIRPGDNTLLFPSNDLDADQNEKRDGFFNTDVRYGLDSNEEVDRTVLVFTPTFPYQYDTDYRFQLQMGPTIDLNLSFHTVQSPGLVDVAFNNRGGLAGGDEWVELTFSSPMTVDGIESQLGLEPELEPTSIELSDDGLKALVYYDFEPSVSYDFTFRAPFSDRFDQVATQEGSLSFTSAALPANLSIQEDSTYAFFAVGETPRYTVNYTNVSSLQVSGCALDTDDFYRFSSDFKWADFSCNLPQTQTITLYDRPGTLDQQSIDLKRVFDRSFRPGAYFVRFSSPQYAQDTFERVFLITDTSLTLKKSEQDLLVWATDFATGKPLSSLQLAVRDRDGQLLQRGVTDPNGLYHLQKAFDDDIYVEVIQSGDDSRWGLVYQRWDADLIAQPFGQSSPWILDRAARFFIFMDRTHYQSGDTLHFKGIYRTDRDAHLSAGSRGTVTASVYDSDQTLVHQMELPVLKDGSVDGAIPLSPLFASGTYNLELSVNDSEATRQSFTVDATRESDFIIEWGTSQLDWVLDRESVRLPVAVRMSDGNLLRKGQLSWTLKQTPYYFDRFQSDQPLSYGDWDDFYCQALSRCNQSWVIVDQSSTDLKNGSTTLDFNDLPTNQSYRYELLVTVASGLGEVSYQSYEFLTHPNATYVGIGMFDLLRDPLDPIDYYLATTDVYGAARSGEKVTVELHSLVDGKLESLIASDRVTTQGYLDSYALKADAPLKPGLYRLQAFSHSNGLRSSVDFYVRGDRQAHGNPRLELFANQPIYLPGGRADLLLKAHLPSSAFPVQALVTYERGKVHDYELVTLEGPETALSLSIADTMTPLIYMNAVVFYRGEFLSISDPLLVEPRDHRIIVDILTQDEPSLTQKTIQIRTRNYQGQPVSSSVTLAVTDEIAPLNNPLDTFYANRPLQVTTARNQPLVHLSGPPASFPSTTVSTPHAPSELALYQSSLVTGEDGILTVDIDLPSVDREWTLRAIATSEFDAFGAGSLTLVDAPSIELTPYLPRFLRSEDEVVVRMNIQNQSDEKQSVSVELSADPITVISDSVQTITVDPYSVTWIDWLVRVPTVYQTQDVELRFTSLFQEVVEPIRLYPTVGSQTRTLSGYLDDPLLRTLTIPSKDSIVLQTSFARSPDIYEDALFESLTHFDFDSAEGLASRLWAFVITKRGSAAQPLLGRLASFQNSDGGFRRWPSDFHSDPMLTAYITRIIFEANRVVALPRTDLTGDAIEYLLIQLRDGGLDPNEMAYVLWSLSELGQFDTRATVRLFEDREDLDLLGQMVLWMNLNRLHEAGQTSVYRFIERLQSELITTLDDQPELFSAYTRAVLLLGLAQVDESNSVLPALVESVVSDLSFQQIYHPQLVAWQLAALSDYSASLSAPKSVSFPDLRINRQSMDLSGSSSFELNPAGVATDAYAVQLVPVTGQPLWYLLSFQYHDSALFESSVDDDVLLIRHWQETDSGTFLAGEVYRVEMTVVNPEPLNDVFLEHPLPTGFSLFSVDDSGQWIQDYGVTNDALWLHAKQLSAGVHQFSFLVRAGYTGVFDVPPASLHTLGGDNVFARTRAERVTVK